MAAENVNFFQWSQDHLSQLLGFPVGDDMIKYILSLESEREMKEHLHNLLDLENHETQVFMKDFFQKWKPDVGGSIVYKKHENLIHITQKKQQTSKSKQTINDNMENINTSPLNIEQKTPEKPDKISVDVTGSSFLDKNSLMPEEIKINKSSSPFKKKNLKYVPLYSADGKVKSNVVLLPGRHPCQCLAQKHKLISNCLECGRIVCEQEGSGPCMFCGNLVCSTEEQEIINRESKQGRKLKEKLLNQIVTDSCVENENEKLQKAIAHKNRLIEFDKNCTKRTKVIDDEADYFAADNKWLTNQQRDVVRKRDKELRDKRFASRLDKKFTIDFAGRKIVDSEEENFAYVEEDIETPLQSLRNNDVNSLGDNDGMNLMDPRISMKPLKFDSSSLDPHSAEVTKKLCKQEEAVRNMLRLQDKELQEISDQGMCLSMHQPWASLLVLGIKKLEGRSWYSAHRGRLWIASTAKPPEKSTIELVQEQYRRLYTRKNKKIDFPKEYPISVLLGCVNVADCASAEEYLAKYPDCEEENESHYLFVCENPEELKIKFQMKGKHKIYKLEPHIHKAARKNLKIT